MQQSETRVTMDRITEAAQAAFERNFRNGKWENTTRYVQNDWLDAIEAAAAVLSGPDEALRVAVKEVINERDSDLDMWHCPYGAQNQTHLYNAWFTAVQESWQKLESLKAILRAALSHPAAPRMDPTMQDEVRDTRQDAPAKAEADVVSESAKTIQLRVALRELEATRKNADFLRKSVGACHMMISRNDLNELDGEWDATDLPPRLKKFITETSRQGWVPLGEVDKFLLSDLSDDFGPEVVERLHNVLTPAERTEVTVETDSDSLRWTTVSIDGRSVAKFASYDQAKEYAAGLRAELEKE
jgi:hypothetical protein